MRNSIRNNDTGELFDIRLDTATTTLDNEHRKLTYFSDNNLSMSWQKLQKEKTKRNNNLLVACENGELEKTRKLLDRKENGDSIANINAKGLDGFTPLHFAVNEGHFEIVKFLIENSAYINSISYSKRTPLHLACEKGKISIIQILLQHKAFVNSKDDDGNTPLHYLSSNGWEEALNVYINWNPDLNIKNIYNETPLEIAKNITTRNMLLKYYKNTKIKQHDKYVRTVIQNIILHNNRADTIKSLLFKLKHIKIKQLCLNAEKKIYSVPFKSNAKLKRSKLIEAAYKISSVKIPRFTSEASYKRILNSFDIIHILGQGSFAKVYLIKCKVTGKLYAMKVMPKQRIFQEKLIKYIEAEKKILCEVQNPFIVRIEAAFQSSEQLFIILQYCPGYIYI